MEKMCSLFLPNGFGKSFIYQGYAFVRNVLAGPPVIRVVEIPPRSIVQAQLRSNVFELKAEELFKTMY